ncbi:hypothetical protein SCACP_15830 [Sporomusa carbonis]
MPENRDIMASKGIPAESQVVSEISVNDGKFLRHSDLGYSEKNGKGSDRR